MAFPSNMSSGFNLTEATTLLSIAQQTYVNTPDNPPSPIKGIPPVPNPPSNWEIDLDRTPTRTTLLDNFWQVWRNQDNPAQYVVAVRGTVDTSPSIFADLLLPIIKARISLKLPIDKNSIHLDFNLAQDELDSAVVAGVHAGFTLSLLLMLISTDKPLCLTLADFDQDAQVYITGHSQGASIALLMTSLVRHSKLFSTSVTYKTYVFAPAKPGNDHYAYDLDQIAGVAGYVYSIVNSQDWVPQVPLSLEGLNSVNTPNPLKKFSGQSNIEIPKIVADTGQVEENVHDAGEKVLKKLIGEVQERLPTEKFVLTAADLSLSGDKSELKGTAISEILDQLLGLLLPTLNYTKAGTLVPVFGTPGRNPDDNGQFDFFWQHHLGNYLKYLQKQYG